MSRSTRTCISSQSRPPIVSIITPTYNQEAYIRQCIESVLSQTFTDWEQIIIDDGSTDETLQIVSGYKDDRIRYLRQNHQGIWKLGKTYTKALALARGNLIAILEGDDFWPSDKLEKQIPAFDDKEVVLTWGIGIYVNEKGKPIGRSKKINFPQSFFENKHKVIRKLLFRNFITPTVTVMVRKDALCPKGFSQPSHVPFVDYPTWFALALRGRFHFIEDVLGYWRRHSGQMSVGRMWDMEKGNQATYWDLWRTKQISLVILLGLIPFSLAKYFRRVIQSKLGK